MRIIHRAHDARALIVLRNWSKRRAEGHDVTAGSMQQEEEEYNCLADSAAILKVRLCLGGTLWTITLEETITTKA